MAKRPAVLPAWATLQYGGHGPAWDEALAQCRSVLYDWASARQCGFYSDLTQLVTAIPWPEGPYTHEGNQLGYLLGQVAMRELDLLEDRPLISALVVGKESSIPTGGFWSLLEELNVPVGSSPREREAMWIAELRRCFDTYGKPPPTST